MSLRFVHETPPTWDAEKETIVGGVPPGSLSIGSHRPGDLLPGEWWRVEDGTEVVGYGWMDTNWGDAEILLAVHPQREGQGIGSFILDRLEDEARARGLNHLHNVVPASHPRREAVSRWLQKRRFQPSEDGQDLRRVVASSR